MKAGDFIAYSEDDTFFRLPLKELYPDEYGRLQQFYSATTTFIINRDRVLLIRHTKKNKAAGDNYIGIGGKASWQHIVTGDVTTSIPTRATKSIHAVPTENNREIAKREVQEETSDKDAENKYDGLIMDDSRMFSLGISQVRYASQDKNTLWEVPFFGYIATDVEAATIKTGQTREGIIEWVPVESLENYPMQPTDRVMLKSFVGEYHKSINQNRRPSDVELRVEGIYGEEDKGQVMRVRIVEDDLTATAILIPDLSKPEDYFGKTVDMSENFYTLWLHNYIMTNRDPILFPNGCSPKRYMATLRQELGPNKVTEHFSFPEHLELTPLTGNQHIKGTNKH